MPIRISSGGNSSKRWNEAATVADVYVRDIGIGSSSIYSDICQRAEMFMFGITTTISASFGRLVSADIGALMKNFVTNKHLEYLQLC